MKKLILLFSLLALFAACSDDETDVADATDPFLPVTSLEIPKRAILGRDIVLRGKGFSEGCSIQLELHKGGTYDTEIVSIGADSIVVRNFDIDAGFYTVLLNQDERTYRLGGINIVATELEKRYVDAIGVAGEEGSRVYEISIARKMKGDLLFSLPVSHTFAGGVMAGDVWYYASYWTEERFEGNTFLGMIRWNTVSAYNLTTREHTVIKPDFEGFMAMGLINGQMHIFRYDATKCYVDKWENGSFSNVVEFNNITANRMTTIYDGIFLYDAPRRNLVMSGQDMKGDTRKFVWALNLDNPIIRETGGETSMIFHLVDCNGKFYAFGEKVNQQDNADTYVVQLANPADWTYTALNPLAVFSSTWFGYPVYDKEKNLIYSIDDGETVATYDLQTHKFKGGKWISSEMSAVYLIDKN